VKKNPFDYVKSVSYEKEDIMLDEQDEKSYSPYLTNRALSYHEDSIYFTNEMNTRFDTENRLQYLFFLNILRKRKRFSNWEKPQENDQVDIVSKYYDVSTSKAKEYFSLLTANQIEVLKERMDIGGSNVRGPNITGGKTS